MRDLIYGSKEQQASIQKLFPNSTVTEVSDEIIEIKVNMLDDDYLLKIIKGGFVERSLTVRTMLLVPKMAKHLLELLEGRGE